MVTLGSFFAIKIGLELGNLAACIAFFVFFLSPRWLLALTSRCLTFVTLPRAGRRRGGRGGGGDDDDDDDDDQSALPPPRHAAERSSLLGGSAHASSLPQPGPSSSSTSSSSHSSAAARVANDSARVFDRPLVLNQSLLHYLRCFVAVLAAFAASCFSNYAVYRETTFTGALQCPPAHYACFAAYQNAVPLLNATTVLPSAADRAASGTSASPRAEADMQSLLYLDFGAAPLARDSCAARRPWPGVPASWTGPVDVLCLATAHTALEWVTAVAVGAAFGFWALGGGFSLLTFLILLFTGTASAGSGGSGGSRSGESGGGVGSGRARTCGALGSRMGVIACILCATSFAIAVAMLCAFAVRALDMFATFALLYAAIALFLYSMMLFTAFRVFDAEENDESNAEDLDDLLIGAPQQPGGLAPQAPAGFAGGSRAVTVDSVGTLAAAGSPAKSRMVGAGSGASMHSPQFGSLTRESPRHGKAAAPAVAVAAAAAGATASGVAASPLSLPTPASAAAATTSSRPHMALASRNFMVDDFDDDGGGAPADDGFVLGHADSGKQ